MKNIKIIDSHTGGEPTRLIVDGVPKLGDGSMAERRDNLARRHDWIRRATVMEPRGFEAMVGAVLQDPSQADCAAGVIFYNNSGYLNMCVHGTIGVAVTLKHMGRIDYGAHRIETPVGVVTVHLDTDGSVSVDNVPSYRKDKGVCVAIPGYGEICGDVAWGGNWFYLVENQGPPVEFDNIDELTQFAVALRGALAEEGITGDNGMEIDHIEVFGPTSSDFANSRNFVLCPGNEYDRSACGTGTSARLACLAASGALDENQPYRQASILDTVMTGRYRHLGDAKVIPNITASAWVNGETTVIFDDDDPFKYGIGSRSISKHINAKQKLTI